MSVLLTGGAGYIGSHTAVAMIQAGYDIVIADDLSNSDPIVIDRIEEITGVRPAFRKENVCEKEAVESIFSSYDISCVIHFAGFKAVGESVAKPLMYYRNNLDSALTVLEVMKEHGCHDFIFSSSATVYGDHPSPYTEETPIGNCSNPYGWTKYMIEEILRSDAASDPELSVVLLRYFNPVGAHESGLIGEDPNGVPNNLMPYITQVAVGRREKLTVFGNDFNTPDGTGVRDYIHVCDLAEGHLAAVRYAAEHKGCEVFNLGTGNGVSVLDMINAFAAASGRTIPYEIGPRRSGDLDSYYSVAEKAEKVLGWKAKRSLSDMCRDSWNWQKKNPNGYKSK